jgi:Inositol phospholipid synthesis and fat-storage-inducing TM
MTSSHLTAFYALTTSITIGVIYSVIFNTYLDTSDPLISSLPHPLRHQSYFANKSNVFNTWFVKRAWGWTSAAFFALFLTSPAIIRSRKRVVQYILATSVWAAFTTWFFGPAIIDRIVSYSGGQCIVVLPSQENTSTASYVNVSDQFCETKIRLSHYSHPELFTTPFALPNDFEWSARARYLKGHDVSGHIFLLTLSVLFLADQLKPSITLYANQRIAAYVSGVHRIAMYFAFALSALWLWMVLMTGVYWHTPSEKASGFGALSTPEPTFSN